MASGTKRAWKLQEFVAHGATVNCLALGRKSGRVMVTGGEDKKVNLWAIGKPNCIMSLTGHTTAVECVKFGYAEDKVCAGSTSGALKIWDLEAAKLIRTLTGHKANVRCLDFHPYAEFIASGSTDTNIKFWDARRKGCIYTYKGHSKMVNSVKFSPDGRWIASGGEDGTVKLWDLPAGKMLTEFRGHTAPVSDVEFHPNEFLLASGSADRTVKFWDLESLQLVSSTDGDSGPIKCIYFNPNGDCLFSGAQDLLKVYGWEPTHTYDSLAMGWGKVTDITTSQQQLIAGAFSLTNVLIYVVDLKRVQPMGSAPNQAKTQCISESPFSPGNRMRKSFVKGKPSGKQSDMMVKVSEETETCSGDADSADDALSFADISNPDDYIEIFHPRNQYVIKATDSNIKVVRPTEKLPAPFVPPFESTQSPLLSRLTDQSHSQATTRASSLAVQPLNTTFTKPPEFKTTLPLPVISSSPSATITSPVKPVEKSTAIVRHTSLMSETTSTISIVRPVPIVPEKDSHPQRAIIYPEQQRRILSDYHDFIPDQRDRPAGLDVDEFLPKHLQDAPRFGVQPQPMSEAEAMSAIIRGHQSMIAVLQHRQKNLRIVMALWTSKDLRTAMESATSMNDPAVLVDILNVLLLRPPKWNLDMCQLLLPSIYELLQSKYETYMTVGCLALKLILKNFASVIKNNITAPPGIGVDISREERYNKCMSCYNHLLSIRTFLLKRQTLQGKLGQSFRELHILMQQSL